jgi:hypothetical protein
MCCYCFDRFDINCLLFYRGPFVVAMGKSWCPDHFICANPRCGEKLIDIGFVEENGFLYCEKDYELYFAPHCAKCEAAIIGVSCSNICDDNITDLQMWRKLNFKYRIVYLPGTFT